MPTRDNIEIDLDIGEDFAVQFIWQDEDGTPIPIKNPVSASINSIAFTTPTVTVNTATAHGLSANDYVTISGASTNGNNGTFKVATAPTTTQLTLTNTSGAVQAGSGGTTKFVTCRADVRDAVGTLVMQFKTGSTAATEPTISVASSTGGVLQLSAPKDDTRLLAPGSYTMDLFATVDGVTSPIANPTVKLFTAMLVAYPRTTIMES
ncbi:hypothetical protein UFOVP1264_52 [uncultured Caudovirales phage]|uniref:Uncharacterized protein n=1 Tax=uncultured Caudovirales phage TaxID=2100421 RepID=A0A6J5RK68_9CAUD|nr:hypothetical protein UFOVP1264_52 [uncultured Caudovirales phage]